MVPWGRGQIVPMDHLVWYRMLKRSIGGNKSGFIATGSSKIENRPPFPRTLTDFNPIPHFEIPNGYPLD